MDRDHARPIRADRAHVRALTYILICECRLIELTRAPRANTNVSRAHRILPTLHKRLRRIGVTTNGATEGRGGRQEDMERTTHGVGAQAQANNLLLPHPTPIRPHKTNRSRL